MRAGSLPRRSTAVAGLLLLLAAGAPRPAPAQVITGTVREETSALPIRTAAVQLIDSHGRSVLEVFSDERGRFVLRLPAPATYHLSASRLGYTLATTDPFFVGPGQERSMDIHLAVEPVWLNALRVATESRVAHLQAKGFYRRLELGFGHFMVREQIERRAPARVSDLFYGLPGVRVSGDTVALRGCAATIVLDGVILLGAMNQVVSPYDIEAIEVFPTPAGVPPEYWRGPCGTILIWTRR